MKRLSGMAEEFTVTGRPQPSRAQLRQIVAGLLALPLSVLPFVAYATMTPEGRLVRDRVQVSLRPPTLPTLSPSQKAAVIADAPRYRTGVMVLAYHGINSSDAEGGFVISPKRFAEHLATLRAAGMHTVTASDVARSLTGGRRLPDNAVMISFDDGRTDAMLFADPLLAQAHMSATMFVISGRAAQPGVYYASWDAIESYARSGRWDIESHTASSHFERRVADGRKLPALTSLGAGESLTEYRARVRADLSSASSSIEAHTGRRPVAFAYPFGAYGADRTNDPGIRRVLREEVERRYELAFHQDEQDSVPLVWAEQDRLSLRRLEVGNWSGLELLRRTAAAARRSGLELPGIGTLKTPAVPTPKVVPPTVAPTPSLVPVPLPPVPVPDVRDKPLLPRVCTKSPLVDRLAPDKVLGTCPPAADS
jgi:peptidoglycan/xylan/chitin deacetylase (PgdA/CDA1 family)